MVAVALVAVAPPLAAAQESFEWYVEPDTPQAREVASLFNLTLGIALAVFLLVEGLLVYTLWRFRKNRKVPLHETHRGHAPAEIVWTVIPAGILIFLGVLSAGTLVELDTVPDDVDYSVRVEAVQWGWRFVYPDNSSTFNELRVEEGSRVSLDITSLDVIHAVWIPEFALKLDAVPNKVQSRWFDAPAVTDGDPDEYLLQCAEYCGTGHHDMRAMVVVFPSGSQPLPYGKAPAG